MATRLDSLEQVEVSNRAEWRAWLKKHHTRTEGVWLISYKKHVADKYLDYDSIVEEALCYGWIDSLPRKLDADRKMLYICPRKPKSVWSRVNKERIPALINKKLMTAAGMAKIEAAKKDGSWTSLDANEAMHMPEDLLRALVKNKKAEGFFNAFPPSTRKAILLWITSAKAEQTRNKRIAETVSLAAKNIRANQYQPKGDRR